MFLVTLRLKPQFRLDLEKCLVVAFAALMRLNSIRISLFSIILALTLLVSGHYSLAAVLDQDEQTANLLGDTIIPPTTTFGRQVRPINQVAENVTIITREDMERLHAHCLSDVLQYYPGVLPFPLRMPFDLSVPMVQGLPNRQTLVTLDGIQMNNGSDGTVDIGIIPVGFLERIEIVKGPAASVWGRSVGAVINLVTVEPNKEKLVSGRLIGTLGSKQTEYGGAELNGYIPKTGTGYYLAAYGEQTKGFQTGINGKGSGVYAKLTQDIGPNTDVTGLFARGSSNNNIIYDPIQNIRGASDAVDYYAIGKLHHRFSLGSDFDAQLYVNSLDVDTHFFNLQPIPFAIPFPGVNIQSQGIREETEGLQLSYKKSASKYWFTLGLDATIGSLRNSSFSLAPPPVFIVNTRNVNRPYNVAEYFSGGYNITPKLTLTGSYRFDWFSDYDATHSPSVGAIYQITDKTLWRTTWGYGYSLPTVRTGSREFETLWRAQTGIETNDIPGLWLKFNGFYDRTKNVKLQLIFFDQNPEVNHNLTREGYEVEVKTLPVLDTTLGLGYTYTHIFNTDTGADIKELPKHQLLLSANYKNTYGTDASLFGRYTNWNGTSSHDQFVWDFLLTQKIYGWKTGNANLTFSVLNFTNANQQTSNAFPNQPLRVNAGFRVNF